MAETALIEDYEAQKSPLQEVTDADPEPIDPNLLINALTPTPLIPEETPIVRIPTPEIQISQMAGGDNYDALRVQTINRDQDRLNRAAIGALSLPSGAKSITQAVREIANTKIPKRTLGEYVSEAILPDHPLKNKKQTGSELNIAEGKNITANSIKQNLGFPDSYQSGMDESTEIAKEAMNIVTPASVTIDEVDGSSLNDFLEFINPLFGEDPKGMDIQVWEAVKGIATGTFDSKAFDEQMTSNYGEEWVGRFAAFAVKEVAIDGALLILASTVAGAPLAAALFGGRRAATVARALKFSQQGIRANATGIIARSTVVGLGGGSVQSVQNAILDRDLNFGTEVAFRFGGNAIFEGAALGVRTGFRSLKGRNLPEITENLAVNQGIKALTRKQINKIMDGEEFGISPYASLTRENLFTQVEGYQKLSGNISDHVLAIDEAGVQVKEGLAAFLGVDRAKLPDMPMEAIIDDIVKFRTRIEEAGADALINQAATTRGLTPHLLTKIRGKYENSSGISQIYLDGNTLQFRANENNLNRSSNRIINAVLQFSKLAEPSRVAGSVGADWLATKNFSATLSNGFTKLYEDALGKLRISGKGTTKFSQKEMNTINEILVIGDVDNMVFDFETVLPRNIDPTNITPKMEEAYIKTRMIMDLAFELRDKSLVKAVGGSTKNIKTGKVFGLGDDYVEITKRGARGKYEARIYNRDIQSSTGGRVIKDISSSRFKDIDTIIPFRNGHIPRGYQPHKYALIILDSKNGTIGREALFNSRVEAEKFLRQREALITPESGESAAIIFNNSDTGLTSTTLHRQSMNILNATNKADREGIAQALKNAGLDTGSVRYFFRDLAGIRPLKGGGIRGRTKLGSATTEAGKELRLNLARAKKRVSKLDNQIKVASKSGKSIVKLKKSRDVASKSEAQILKNIEENIPNEIAPTQEALVDYMGMVAHNVGHDNWRKVAIDTFNTKYGKFLDDGGAWHNAHKGAHFKRGVEAPSKELKSEIERFSRFVNRNISGRTFGEKYYDWVVTRAVDRLGKAAADGSLPARATQALWDRTPLARDLGNFFRWSAAFPKLLFYPFVQIWIQGSQAIQTVSAAMAKDPVGLAQALSQWPRVAFIHARVSAGIRLPKIVLESDSYAAYQAIRKAGYTADLTTADTLFAMRDKLDVSFGRKLIKGIAKSGSLPFRAGESINRTTAFLVVRKQFMRAIDSYERALKAGKSIDELADVAVRGRNGEILRVGDIDGNSFSEAVITKAQVTAFNMGKAGELEAFSGLGSVIFQFKQVGIKQISMFDSVQLSKWEKMSALVGLVGFWGAGAFPLLPDLFKLTDNLYYNTIGGEDPNKLREASDYARVSAEWLADAGKNLAGLDPEFTKRLLESGAIAAFTDNEVNISSRIALGSIWSDTFEVQSGTDYIVSLSVIADFLGMVNQIGTRDLNIVNPLSWFEIQGHMAKGLTFKEAVLLQFNPQSTIGKFIAGDTTVGSASLEALREIGKVFSQVGSISRALDAANKTVTQPDVTYLTDNLLQTFSTSSLRPLGIEATTFRKTQTFIGVTPGPVIAQFELKKIEFKYKEAMRNFQRKFLEDLRNAGGPSAAKRTILLYGIRVKEHGDNMVRMGLDIQIVRDTQRQANLAFFKILQEITQEIK